MSSSGDPIRFRDSALPEEKELGRLFRAAEEDVPNAGQLESLAGRLGPELGVPLEPKSAPRAFSKLGALGGAAAILAIVGGLLVSRSKAPVEKLPPPSQSSSAPGLAVPKEDVRRGPLQVPVPSAAPSQAQPSASAMPPPSAAKTAPAKPGEATLLEEARRALATDPNRALALTRRHQALYPRGVLVQEREVIAIEALRRLGREGQASERANTFEKSYPDSAHRRAVEKGLNP